MLDQIAARIRQGESFAFETTLSGRSYARQIPMWRAHGYYVKLLFLSLPSAELAVARVRSRVAQGGHNVPEDVVRRRFDLGLRNFYDRYQRIVNSWAVFDNSGATPKLLAAGDNL